MTTKEPSSASILAARKPKPRMWCIDPRHSTPCALPCPACEAECDHKHRVAGINEAWDAIKARSAQASNTRSFA